jgi:hypothetical protein
MYDSIMAISYFDSAVIFDNYKLSMTFVLSKLLENDSPVFRVNSDPNAISLPLLVSLSLVPASREKSQAFFELPLMKCAITLQGRKILFDDRFVPSICLQNRPWQIILHH